MKTYHTKQEDTIHVYINSNDGAKSFKTARGEATKYVQKQFKGDTEDHGMLCEADNWNTYTFLFKLQS